MESYTFLGGKCRYVLNHPDSTAWIGFCVCVGRSFICSESEMKNIVTNMVISFEINKSEVLGEGEGNACPCGSFVPVDFRIHRVERQNSECKLFDKLE